MKKLLLYFLIIPVITLAQNQIGDDIEGQAADLFGISIDISASGSIFATGAPGPNEVPGTVRVFENVNGVWVQVGDDIVGETPNDSFGIQVSLSSDGSIVAVGTPFNDGNGNNSGHVRVFRNEGGVWTQIGDDINGATMNDLSGGAVRLSDDGSIVAIGAVGNDNAGSGAGHVRVFQNQNDQWQQIGSDINGLASTDQFGSAIGLSANGSIFVAGSPNNDGVALNAGNARVFENQGGVWTPIGQIITGEAASDEFGEAVDISANGSIIAIGAPNSDENGAESGSIRVFENQNGSWEQIGQKLTGAEAGSRFGRSLSLSSDGNLLAVGVPSNDPNIESFTVIFENQNGVWTEILAPIAEVTSGDFSGFSVKISGNAEFIVIGEPFNDDNGDNAGQVRVFDLEEVLSTSDFEASSFTLLVNNEDKFIQVNLSDGNQELKQINMYNINGQRLLSSTQSTFSKEGLSSGIYIVQTETTAGRGAQKVILD